MDFLVSYVGGGDASKVPLSWLLRFMKIDEIAESRMIFNSPHRHDVVPSKAINAVMHHYIEDAMEGVTYVCYGPDTSGKRTAAAYLLHGKHNMGPHRAIMIQSGHNPNIARTVCGALDFPLDADPEVHKLLVGALVSEEKRAEKTTTPHRNWFETQKMAAKDVCAQLCHRYWSSHPAMFGFFNGRPFRMREHDDSDDGHRFNPRPHHRDLPLLVVDDLSNTEKNTKFVLDLAAEVKTMGATALITVKHKSHAEQLVDKGFVPVPRLCPSTSKPLEWTDLSWDDDEKTKLGRMLDLEDFNPKEFRTPTDIINEKLDQEPTLCRWAK